MSQNTLIEKIKEDAEKAVSEIKATVATKIANIQSEADKTIKSMVEVHENLLQKRQDQIKLVAVSKAKQAGKISLQQAKRNQINKIFSEVAVGLSEQSSEKYVAFYSKCASSIVPKDVAVTSVQAPDNRESETKQILEKMSLEATVSVNSDIKAGFILETVDGVYDVTLNRIMNEKKSELEMEVVKKVMV